ncbi:MAG: DotU family type IV/VI secretion system protein [Pseudomonadota bacterium]
MKLLSACEPVLLYMCGLNRSVRKGAQFDADSVRAEVLSRLAEARARCAAEAGLARRFDRVELALIYFVDYIIKESELPWAHDWRELAHDRGKMAGDEEFFDLVEEALAETGAEVAQELEVYYVCMGLGFMGLHLGQPEKVRAKMAEIRVRLPEQVSLSSEEQICPPAYQHTDGSDLIQPPGRLLAMIGIVLVGLVVVLFAANAYLYHSSASSLVETFRNVSGAEVPAEGQP